MRQALRSNVIAETIMIEINWELKSRRIVYNKYLSSNKVLRYKYSCIV